MKIFNFIFFYFLIIIAHAQTITTSAPLQTSLCAGGNIVVEYQTTGTFNIPCTFTAQLSDNWGNFTNPINIGSMPINTGVILGTIPANTTLGINYRVRVVSDNPAIIGSESPNPPIIITSTAVSATIITDPGTEVCEGNSVNLWVTPNQSYYWSNGQTTQSIDVTESGTYNVTVTNFLTGCEVSSTPVTINVHPLPEIYLGPDTSFCDGNSVLLDAGPGYTNYSWNAGISQNQTLEINSTGIWQVAVTDTNGCTNKDTISITVNPNPSIFLGSDTIFCGNHLYLNAGSGFSFYNWNNGLSFNPVLDVTQAGVYHVVITDQNQCTSSDTINVTINQPPVINLGNDLIICGNSAVLNAGNGFVSYNWNNGLGNNQYLPVTQSGEYTINVTSSNGCHGYDTIFVNLHHLPAINLGSDFTLLSIDSCILDAGAGFDVYSWSTGSTSQFIQINGWDYSPGAYNFNVTVVDSVGCFNSDQVIITIIESSGIDETFLENFTIYPNPFMEQFTVTLNHLSPDLIPVLIDISGRNIFPEFKITENSLIINCPLLTTGIYHLLLFNSASTISIGKVISK